jgi:hypothetical protein
VRIEGRLLLRPLARRLFVQVDPVRFSGVPSLPGGCAETPRDYILDFGSVPWLLTWWADPLDPQQAPAYLLHDLLYERHRVLTPCGVEPVSRREADDAMRAVMVYCGTRASKARAIWLGVRVGGWRAYRTGPARREARQALYDDLKALDVAAA